MSKAGSGQKKKNVQVVVRVRPLNGTEILQKSRNVVSCNRDNRVLLKEKGTNLRPYGPFDKVYGEDTSQIAVYKDVVAPLITHVLNGYNCTVFAYGQTGSGKTYTMEGHHDEDGAYSWEDDPKAGIIPRALHHIFSTLEAERPEDYSVRASYVELYNEQIYDLLSSSTAALRVYDSKENGIVISGMEDVPVRNRQEVYEILKKGADRRKTASTLMNINSSRSHSVFTLTVTTRQTIDDEELLRVGKMHLVDLAGSENVGRSGAIDQRAREAGNINTSLLALGRVITALTSNAGHIPYRESKLTRILQDSLGGKTITTIIATLSPASINYEESVSTLEYGQRAKNIKNNPEANKCVSRKRILLAYDEEIQRLQRDLASARGGQGFYVDKENYEQMQTENVEQKEKIEELEMDLADKLERLSNVNNDLAFMDEQYQLAYEDLKLRTSRYERKIREQEKLKKDLSDMSNNYNSALDALEIFHQVADKIRSREQKHHQTVVDLFGKLDAAQEKIQQFREIEDKNDHVLGNFIANYISSANSTKANVVEGIRSYSGNMVKELERKLNELKQSILAKCDKTISQNNLIKEVSKQSQEQCSSLLVENHSTVNSGAKEVVDAVTSLTDNVTELAKDNVNNMMDVSKRLEQLFTVIDVHKQRFVEAITKTTDLNDANTSKVDSLLEQVMSFTKQLLEQNQSNKRSYSQALENIKKPVDNMFDAIDMMHQAEPVLKKMKMNSEEVIEKSSESAQKVTSASDKLIQDSQNNTEKTKSVLTCNTITVNEYCGTINQKAFDSKLQIEESSEVIYTMVEKEDEHMTGACDKLNSYIDRCRTQIEHVVHQELKREVHSGSTPSKKLSPALLQASFTPIPSKEQLLKDTARTPQRASIFRTRDTILENDLPVQSPNTLKAVLPSVLKAQAEQEE